MYIIYVHVCTYSIIHNREVGRGGREREGEMGIEGGTHSKGGRERGGMGVYMHVYSEEIEEGGKEQSKDIMCIYTVRNGFYMIPNSHPHTDNTNTCLPTHARLCARTHTHTHARMHAHTHTHTHTRTHTRTRTHSASERGFLELVDYLLDNRAVAVASPVSNHTALHLACRRGHTDVALTLLSRLPALLAIDDSPIETSLHIAAREGHVEIVRNLLAVAARAEQLKSFEQLESGEKERLRERERRGEGRERVSLYGSGNERVQMNIEALDSLGEVTIDIMAPTASDWRTPLHEAAAGCHVEVVKLIIEFMKEHSPPGGRSRGAGVSPRAERDRDHSSMSPGRYLDTPPQFMTPGGGQGKKSKAVHGIDQMTLRGRTALHEAAKQGHFEVMRVLLEAGADINLVMRPALDVTANPDLTALVQACLMNRADIVRFLLKNGATDARLKALKRTLRMSFNDIAGLLLCYNGGAHPSTDLVHRKLSRQAGKETLAPQPTMLDLAWNSKELPYIGERWLELVCLEVPVSSPLGGAISVIDISSNCLTALPVELFQLSHLTQVDASRNEIAELPSLPGEEGHGWNCPNLSSLDISSNHISSLPSCLFHLHELKEVNANNNRITDVPAAVWTTPKLTKLHLNHNLLDSFPSHSSDPSPHFQSPPAGIGGGSVYDPFQLPESGYQSIQALAPLRSILSTQNMLTGSETRLSHSDSMFDEGVGTLSGVWGQRRKSTGLSSILGTSKPRQATIGLSKRRMSANQSFVSWRFKSFQDATFDVEDLDDIGREEQEEGGETFPLESLDLSYNHLITVPNGLSCFAPRLTKLNVSHNQIKSLGQLNDYPPDIELLDASHNHLMSALTEPISHGLMPCSRRLFLNSSGNALLDSTSSPSYKPCVHRTHKNLRKLSTYRVGHNQLVDVQLFRAVGRNRSGDLTSSFDDASLSKHRTNTTNDPFAVPVIPKSNKKDISKSMSVPVRDGTSVGQKKTPVHRVTSGDTGKVHCVRQRGSNSSNSGGSQEDASPSPSAAYNSPLFPVLSTLEVGYNRLHTVPSSLHLVSTLACLDIGHNAIETLPLELSYLDHLWNLEYEGCNLISPPKQDLDKYRLAADKLLYMKSLLHE